MECSKKMSVKIPTTDRCNEMIRGFENQIKKKFKLKNKYRYNGEERKLLIKTIKENPTHFWEAGINGLIHYEI